MKDLVSWLEKHHAYPKVYWKGRGSDEAIAGAGQNGVFEEMPKKPRQPYFGGISFHQRHWKGFPPVYFFSPKDLARDIQPQLVAPPSTIKPYKRTDSPNDSDWKRNVEHALFRIQRKQIDKIVLARKTSLLFTSTLNPYDMLRHLLSSSRFSTVFLLQITPEETLIGATPEKLYVREGLTISSEAMAGSRPRGKNEIEDEKMKNDLLSSEKEKREFAFVKQFIHAELSPLCEHLKWGDTTTIQTASMHHLYARVIGTLKSSVSDRQILDTLHPTPAMGGFPRHKAMAHLQEEEPFDRGWYAAPIGWIEQDRADFAIAIRSALIIKHEMHLFAGTGIVDGSSPEQEWEELNQKISPYLQVLS